MKHIKYLQNLIDAHILDIHEGNEKILRMKEKKVNEIHKRAINTRSDGRYVTKIVHEDNLKQISASTYKELIDKLFDFYYGDINITLSQIFPRWVAYRKFETSVTNKTVQEDFNLWKKYLMNEEITKKPISKLKVQDFIIFFRKITVSRELTRKKFNNLKSVLNGLMYYSIENGIIEHNFLNDINYSQFSFKASNSEILPFTEEERIKVLENLEESDLYDLAIKLMFYLTIRISELKGLRFDDVQGDFIHISRFVNHNHQIENHIKGNTSEGIRFLPLPDEAKRIIYKIKEINPDSDYLFMIDSKKHTFITTVTFNRHLKKICSKLGILYRSSHKVRFSTASILCANGVSEVELQKMLGHTTLSMTHHYLRNVNSRQQTFDKVNDILK